ncbi:MAG: beta-glucoside-specific PTS transporter subunit IIABC [Mycoplasmatales bacterium]
MAKYTDLVNEILKNIGGKENIISLTHCVTRLRFNLKDESLANDEVLKKMDGIVTIMKTAGQYQVVIGNHVPDVYNEFVKVANINADTQVTTAKDMSIIDRIIDILSGIMLPSIGILCASGIIKGFQAMFVAFGIMDTTSGWYTLFYAIGDSMFYFFPVVLGFNAAKKFKMNPYLGLMIGAMLCYPSINGQELVFFGHSFTLTYTATVLPVIFIVALAAPMERFFIKVLSDVIKTFMVPVAVLCISVPLGYLIIGPIANLISTLLGMLTSTIYGLSPILAGIFLGFFWQVFVILGIHMVIVIPSVINLTAGKQDYIMPLFASASFAQTGMVFAIWLKTKDKKLKNIAFPAWISGIFGVTEPAIYGVTLPRRKYFIITCITSALAGALVGALHIAKYTMAGMGIFYYPGNIGYNGETYSFFWLIAITLGTTVITAIIGLLVYKDDRLEEEKVTKEELLKQTESITTPIEGEVKPLNVIEDSAFSEGLLGQGIAINPTQGVVYAPFDSTVVTLFPTKHAIGLISNTGCEILIHIGMDTVKLEGKYFKSYVEQSQAVKKGDKLIEFDIKEIQNSGYSVLTPIIVTNTKDYLDIVAVAENKVKINDEILKVMV